MVCAPAGAQIILAGGGHDSEEKMLPVLGKRGMRIFPRNENFLAGENELAQSEFEDWQKRQLSLVGNVQEFVLNSHQENVLSVGQNALVAA